MAVYDQLTVQNEAVPDASLLAVRQLVEISFVSFIMMFLQLLSTAAFWHKGWKHKSGHETV